MEETRKKAKSTGFAELGIPVGAKLTYRTTARACTVVDAKNRVEFEGQVYTLSGLAKRLVGSQASGYATFRFDGKRLADMARESRASAPTAPRVARESDGSENIPTPPPAARATPTSDAEPSASADGGGAKGGAFDVF